MIGLLACGDPPETAPPPAPVPQVWSPGSGPSVPSGSGDPLDLDAYEVDGSWRIVDVDADVRLAGSALDVSTLADGLTVSGTGPVLLRASATSTGATLQPVLLQLARAQVQRVDIARSGGVLGIRPAPEIVPGTGQGTLSVVVRPATRTVALSPLGMPPSQRTLATVSVDTLDATLVRLGSPAVAAVTVLEADCDLSCALDAVTAVRRRPGLQRATLAWEWPIRPEADVSEALAIDLLEAGLKRWSPRVMQLRPAEQPGVAPQ